jgi:serine/threonine-protein kinase
MDFNDLEPAGVILAQFPLPGNNVKGGTSLRVRVSKGTTLVACPDVRLRVSGEAGVLIRAAELEVGSAGAVFDAEVGKDMVVSQDPPPNSLVARQTKVNLLVSAGPPQNRFVMPNLTDLTANEASALLAALGMRISQTRESSAPGRDNGLIHRQDPPAGAPVTMEDEILVEVTRNDGI